MIVGFTGTRKGMTWDQKAQLVAAVLRCRRSPHSIRAVIANPDELQKRPGMSAKTPPSAVSIFLLFSACVLLYRR